jgi:hypothetical protein
MESVFEPEFSAIIVVDSYSTDGKYEKLRQIEKEFNLTTLHYNNSIALKEKSFQDWLKKKITFYSNRYELIPELISSCKSEGIRSTVVKALLAQALSDKITVTRLSKGGPLKANFNDYMEYVSLYYKNTREILLASLIFMHKSIQLYVARKWYENDQKAS